MNLEEFFQNNKSGNLNFWDKFYDNNDNVNEMVKIINEVKKYNVYDFLSRVTALNLLPENQNKSILTDVLIQAVLSFNIDVYKSNAIMSAGKFRTIINGLNNMSLKYAIDPCENLFIENVMFYGNFLIFSGIEHIPSYNIQMLIKTLIENANKYNATFVKQAFNIIKFCLTISNNIAQKININLEELQYLEGEEILIPNNVTLSKLKEYVVIKNELINNYFPNEEKSFLYSGFKKVDLNSVLNSNYHLFFNSPFLKINDNTSLVLNVSILMPFVFKRILILAQEHNLLYNLLNDYNNLVWLDVMHSFEVLGHFNLEDQQIGSLNQLSNYKQSIMNVFDNQIMIVSYICDDGKDIKLDNVYDLYPSNELNNIINENNNCIYKRLTELGVDNKNIFQVYIINTLGRTIGVQIKSRGYYQPLRFNPFELKCISINENEQSAFIPRYIRAKEKIKSGVPPILTELNSIEIYVSSDYSFYINDDFNPKSTNLFIEPGDSIYYIMRAIKKEKRHLVQSYKKDIFTEVVVNDDLRSIYIDSNLNESRASVLIEFDKVKTWIYSSVIEHPDDLNTYFSIVDSLSYWLYETCSESFKDMRFKTNFYKIYISLNGNRQEYYQNIQDDGEWKDYIEISFEYNQMNVIFSPPAYRLFSKKNNLYEQQMIEVIVNKMLEHICIDHIKVLDVNKCFENPSKRKFYSLDYEKYPYLKPTSDHNFRRIHKEDENELLDEIGIEILENMNLRYGILPDEKRAEVSNYVVGFLYKILRNEVDKFQSTKIAEIVCYDLEIIMHELMLSRERYIYEISCYPELKEKYSAELNELCKSSLAIKFFAEYIAACPPKGTEILGVWQYERLLATCSLIIDWAYKNDLFYYNIFNTQIEILKSDRLGLKRDEFNKLNELMYEAREIQLDYSKESISNKFIYDRKIPYFKDALNEAFLCENGFSFTDLADCIFCLLEIGNTIKQEVKVYEQDYIIEEILKNVNHVNKEKVLKIIDYITLKQRKDFLKPKLYRIEEVYPWRFNRELSFTRRPIIKRDNRLIWGNRQLYHMLKFTLELVFEGKFKCKSKKMKETISNISNNRGYQFNKLVFKRICSVNQILAYANVKKIGKKYISDKNGNALGDIDVLYFIPERKRIILVEVKDFNLSKNPYEMHLEYQKMFIDEGKKRCFASKHKRRREWFEENLKYVQDVYKLCGEEWSVKEIFIVNEPLISSGFYNTGTDVFILSQISNQQLLEI